MKLPEAPPPKELWSGSVPSPVGAIQLVWDEDQRIRSLDFEGHEDRKLSLLRRYYGNSFSLRPAPVPQPFQQAIAAYLAGGPEADKPLRALPYAIGGTDFQRTVWGALLDVGYGQTCSYADIARAIGNPKGVRAVGLANGANPIAILVPCHRVIGANGSLTGYGGGLDRKRWLLRHEGALLA